MTFHVHHIGVAACDVERTLAFYETLFDGRREPLGGHMLVVAGELRAGSCGAPSARSRCSTSWRAEVGSATATCRPAA